MNAQPHLLLFRTFLESLKELKDYVPLFQTLLWVGLTAAAVAIFYKQIRNLLTSLYTRIERGSSFEVGPLKVGAEVRELPKVAPASPGSPEKREVGPEGPASAASEGRPDSLVERLRRHREGVKEKNKYYYLAHVLEPSKDPGQKYDVFIYLIKPYKDGFSGPGDFSKIERADFFLGRYWGDKVFTRSNEGGLIGLRTSAYGPFLCSCMLTFKDGTTALLDRFVDFEMGKVFESTAGRRAGEN